MDKFQAINEFWNSFEWPAYDETIVPDDAGMPRITYSVSSDSLGNQIMIPASLWDYSTSWERISKKADEISLAIETKNPPAIKVDNGRVYLTKGSPYAQRMPEPSDGMIRRIYLNVNAEFFTSH